MFLLRNKKIIGLIFKSPPYLQHCEGLSVNAAEVGYDRVGTEVAVYLKYQKMVAIKSSSAQML